MERGKKFGFVSRIGSGEYSHHPLLSVAGMFRNRDLRGDRERCMRGGCNRRQHNWPVEQQFSDVSSTGTRLTENEFHIFQAYCWFSVSRHSK